MPSYVLNKSKITNKLLLLCNNDIDYLKTVIKRVAKNGVSDLEDIVDYIVKDNQMETRTIIKEDDDKLTVRVNINDKVSIKLTEYGKEILQKYYQNNLPKHLIPEIKNDDMDFMLWEIMQIFGEFLFMGNTEIPFEDNRIILEILKYK